MLRFTALQLRLFSAGTILVGNTTCDHDQWHVAKQIFSLGALRPQARYFLKLKRIHMGRDMLPTRKYPQQSARSDTASTNNRAWPGAQASWGYVQSCDMPLTVFEVKGIPAIAVSALRRR